MGKASTPQAEQWNQRFAEVIVGDAMDRLAQKSGDEHRGFGTETYYTIEIPYAQSSEEFSYFDAMLNGGSMKNPDYMDLFERVMQGMEDATRKTGLRAFITLNCRFDAACDDNFLLYVFLS